jgi:hypothetical protein
MAQPTIKKKQLTVKKTIKRKAAPAANKAAASATAPADGEAAAASLSASAAAKGRPAPRNKKSAKASKEPKAPSYTVFAILALLAACLYIALITVQSMELAFHSPAFPKAVEMGGM